MLLTQHNLVFRGTLLILSICNSLLHKRCCCYYGYCMLLYAVVVAAAAVLVLLLLAAVVVVAEVVSTGYNFACIASCQIHQNIIVFPSKLTS